MIQITICVGSSCSVRGSEELAQALEALIAREGLAGHIELVGSFCMGECSRGVSVRVGDQQYREILPQNAEAFFLDRVLPAARLEAQA